MATTGAVGVAQGFSEPTTERSCELFMETRKWAIDHYDEHPTHTAMMRVVVEFVLNKVAAPLVAFRNKLASMALLSKKIELVGGGVAVAGQNFAKKMEEIRRQMEPFEIFEDAYEGAVTAVGLAKATAVTAKVIEVTARYFGDNVDKLLNQPEEFLRNLSSGFASTIVKAKDIAIDTMQGSLDSLGSHLTAAATELRTNFPGDAGAQSRALDLDMLGGCVSSHENDPFGGHPK